MIIKNLLNLDSSLITIFGKSCSGKSLLINRLVYDAYLNDKKILFIGESKLKIEKLIIRNKKIDSILSNNNYYPHYSKLCTNYSLDIENQIRFIENNIDKANYIFIDAFPITQIKNVILYLRYLQHISKDNNITIFITTNSQNNTYNHISDVSLSINNNMLSNSFELKTIKSRKINYDSNFKLENANLLEI